MQIAKGLQNQLALQPAVDSKYKIGMLLVGKYGAGEAKASMMFVTERLTDRGRGGGNINYVAYGDSIRSADLHGRQWHGNARPAGDEPRATRLLCKFGRSQLPLATGCAGVHTAAHCQSPSGDGSLPACFKPQKAEFITFS